MRAIEQYGDARAAEARRLTLLKACILLDIARLDGSKEAVQEAAEKLRALADEPYHKRA